MSESPGIGEFAILEFPGEWYDRTEEIQSMVRQKEAEGCKKFIFDFTETEFMDSGMLATMIGLSCRLRHEKGFVRVVNTDKHIAKIFEVTMLDKVFPIFRTREEALST